MCFGIGGRAHGFAMNNINRKCTVRAFKVCVSGKVIVFLPRPAMHQHFSRPGLQPGLEKSRHGDEPGGGEVGRSVLLTDGGRERENMCQGGRSRGIRVTVPSKSFVAVREGLCLG